MQNKVIHAGMQRLCAWSGVVGVLFFFGAFVVALFIPPPGPSMTQQEVVSMYLEHATLIRVGGVLMMTSGMFIAPFVGAISVQMRRIEQGTPILSYAQLSIGSVFILFFILPAILFLVTAFRPDRSPELTYLMNDFSWILVIMVWPPAFMQNIVVGLAIINDKSPKPIFPRWFAFFCFWGALLYVPGSLVPFFKTGPFAWNGIFAFWIPGGVFTFWYFIMAALLLKAVKRQEQELAA
jgi:hypothetical protein